MTVDDRPGQWEEASDRIRDGLREGDAVVIARSKKRFSLAGACLIMAACRSRIRSGAPAVAWRPRQGVSRRR
jgi:hypothetical protein